LSYASLALLTFTPARML